MGIPWPVCPRDGNAELLINVNHGFLPLVDGGDRRRFRPYNRPTPRLKALEMAKKFLSTGWEVGSLRAAAAQK